MPIHTYRCENCGHQFDRQQSFAEVSIKVCPKCHKHSLHKVYRPAGVVFKGPGFYATDKHRVAASNEAKKSKSNGASETKGETKGETKTEAKNEKSKPETKDE